MKSKMTSLIGVTLMAALTLTACGSGSENASPSGSGSASSAGSPDPNATIEIGSLYEPQNLELSIAL